jgi:hypothetical protein
MLREDSYSGAFTIVLPTLAALLFLAALIALITGLSLAFPRPAFIGLWSLNRDAYDSFTHLGWVAIAVVLALACIAAATAVGLMLHKRWAWFIALLLFVSNGAGDLISLIRTHNALRFGSGIAIATAFIVLLTLPQIRRTLR